MNKSDVLVLTTVAHFMVTTTMCKTRLSALIHSIITRIIQEYIIATACTPTTYTHIYDIYTYTLAFANV